MPEDRIHLILSMLHDPLFVEFEMEREAPSVFNAVGRTHTETWHSALLGWLFDPKGSHSLGVFPLVRLLLLLNSSDDLPAERREIDLNELSVSGDFSEVRVRPNERELSEVTVSDMRFDIFVDGIQYDRSSWKAVHLLCEVKVNAAIDKRQNRNYIEYTKRMADGGYLVIPVYIAPTQTLGGTPRELLGDDSWMAVDYQSINDNVIEPCLSHPAISTFGKFTLKEYVKTLKFNQRGGEPLATTQKERDLANALLEKHEPAIRALYDILSQLNADIEPLQESGGARQNIKIRVGNSEVGYTEFDEPSVPRLYSSVLRFLCDGRYLDKLQLPMATGERRYLLVRTEEEGEIPRHQTGSKFIRKVTYGHYHMEANKNRADGVRDLAKLLRRCGLSMESNDDNV